MSVSRATAAIEQGAAADRDQPTAPLIGNASGAGETASGRPGLGDPPTTNQPPDEQDRSQAHLFRQARRADDQTSDDYAEAYTLNASTVDPTGVVRVWPISGDEACQQVAGVGTERRARTPCETTRCGPGEQRFIRATSSQVNATGSIQPGRVTSQKSGVQRGAYHITSSTGPMCIMNAGAAPQQRGGHAMSPPMARTAATACGMKTGAAHQSPQGRWVFPTLIPSGTID
jgi:hypothetical protein